MTEPKPNRPIPVGAPDPELSTSPVLEATDPDLEDMAPVPDEEAVCYFNNRVYAPGTFVCAGTSELLRCWNGVWVREGSCDPDNP
ncbi:MAG: hypothetical protein GWO02_07170 [Gammaproteobacteria bacterium]|nr:hypothetical protein [Gammaproteobacteria bacterium]